MQQKKGSDILAIIIFLALLLIIGISFLFFSYIIHTTATIFQPMEIANSTTGQLAVTTMDSFGTNSLQSIFLFILGGFLLTLMLTSFFVDTHPVFLVIYIILLGINLLIAIFVGNAYQMLNTGEMASTYASQTIISTIMENIVRITLIAEALSLVLLFGKIILFKGGSQNI